MVFKDISDAMASLTLESFTLRQFAFSTLADFVKVLDTWRHLKTLQLDSVDISTATHLSVSALEHVLKLQTPNAPTQTSEKKANLRHLLLRSNSSALFIPILLHSRSPLDLSSLTSLIITLTSDNYDSVVDLLRCTPNLETLELEIETLFDYEAHVQHKDMIDLHSMSSLRALSLQISVLLARTNPMPWLVPFLSTAGPRTTSQNYHLRALSTNRPRLSRFRHSTTPSWVEEPRRPSHTADVCGTAAL
ncbi:hypothetical protein BDZ97DRAFT_499640 [Flammula alnicola]|nr:hypothetical protein BDZ97DRAFT_499640 [Flammula alnicola]